jgi:hypothetical protein
MPRKKLRGVSVLKRELFRDEEIVNLFLGPYSKWFHVPGAISAPRTSRADINWEKQEGRNQTFLISCLPNLFVSVTPAGSPPRFSTPRSSNKLERQEIRKV